MKKQDFIELSKILVLQFSFFFLNIFNEPLKLLKNIFHGFDINN